MHLAHTHTFHRFITDDLCTGSIMPLTELMNYFNDQLQLQTRTQSLPATGFYKAGNTYGARFGGLTFSSRFNPIEKRLGHSELIGHDANLLVRAVTGREVSINDVFQSLDDKDQIIHLDRLTRTLHSLNYLQRYDNNALLSLTVQPRHIVSVSAEHGKTFEGILGDCGLGPERVLLHTRLLNDQTLPHFRGAFLNYRARGYKIGIDILQPSDLLLLQQLNFDPDFILLHLLDSTSLATLDTHSLQWFQQGNPYPSRDVKRILVGSETRLPDKIGLDRFDGFVRIPTA